MKNTTYKKLYVLYIVLLKISHSLNILRFYSVEDASYREFLEHHFHFDSFIHLKPQGFGWVNIYSEQN